MEPPPIAFAARGSTQEIECGAEFQPKFDAEGLIAAIVTDAENSQVLMVAWMNAAALSRSLETSTAHFWSRSRKKLWLKGEDSGNVLQIIEMRTDCDQDVIWLRVKAQGPGVACHTGASSCFYRVVEVGNEPGKVGLRRVPTP